MPETDPSDVIHDAINDFFAQLLSFVRAGYTRFTTNLHNSFAQVDRYRWTKVFFSVAIYIIVRPYIEKFFRWSSDRQRKQAEEKEKREKEATGYEGGKKAKVSANALRGTGGGERGKVLGEVEDTEEEVDDEANGKEEEEGEAVKFAKASGVPEWGKNARKRQKKQARNMAEYPSHNLNDDQLLELLDWSEEEGEQKK